MSTLSDILINHDDKGEIISFLSKYYEIGQKESNPEIQLLKYNQIGSKVRTLSFIMIKMMNGHSWNMK
ncbi:hypothetical protein GCM10022393_35210 [Aquimarina addita]|uniref:Uncharacterized protein n=1 Tax=Aquimarina addita TaxID=870485 RepID=A0ABP6UQG3_9FLAO